MRSQALRALGTLTNIQARAIATLRRGQPARAHDVLRRARRILVVRLDETIGDTVMFSPFLRELRRSAPTSSITLVVNRARTDMYRGCPYVDHLVDTDLGSAADRRVLVRPWHAWRLVRRLPGPFDLSFAPRADYDHHAPFVAAMSGAPVLGFDESSSERKRVVARGTDRLFVHPLHATPHRHEIDRQLDLLRHAGGEAEDSMPEVWLDDPTRGKARDALAAAGVDREHVVLAPTGGHSDLKRWPLGRYVEIARRVLGAGQIPVFVGGPGDLGLVDDVPDEVRRSSAMLIGRLAPMVTAAVIERSAGFVGADSGMSHVAAALGVPTVSVFGPTCTHAFAPRGPRSTIATLGLPCGPCARQLDIDRCATCIFPAPLCMDGVSAQQVWDALVAVRATGHPTTHSPTAGSPVG